MEALKTSFDDRNSLIAYVRAHSHVQEADQNVSDFLGGAKAAAKRLKAMDPLQYAKTRNFLHGNVTHLSPYIRAGIVSSRDVYHQACQEVNSTRAIEKFIQELVWRDFWQHVAMHHPSWLWQDAEPYKTGFSADHYADELPSDIASGSTGVACIDAFCRSLFEQGYLHNHARMYLAAYVVHWRRVKWQAGAKWFLHHLLDADLASNNLSWQWVASTLSNKPYIFNLENVAKYAGDVVDVSVANNRCLHGSYAQLSRQLFPHLTGSS